VYGSRSAPLAIPFEVELFQPTALRIDASHDGVSSQGKPLIRGL
jgi:hypothetical protein